MTVLNAPATLEQITNFAADYANATISILDGATVLVTHTATSWTPSNTGNDGTATAVLANGGAETIIATGTPTSATVTSGSSVITVSVGLSGSGADLIISTTFYILNETSTINSLVVTAPASQA